MGGGCTTTSRAGISSGLERTALVFVKASALKQLLLSSHQSLPFGRSPCHIFAVYYTMLDLDDPIAHEHGVAEMEHLVHLASGLRRVGNALQTGSI